jgi:hypothetical protein
LTRSHGGSSHSARESSSIRFTIRATATTTWGRRELGLSRLATIELRRRLNAVNRGIKHLADEHNFLIADLERLFHGHGVASNEPWFVQVIEPNLAGASATAE